MVFGLDKQSYNQTLNIKRDFENYIICYISITLMTSCVGDLFEKHWVISLFLSINCVLFNQFT